VDQETGKPATWIHFRLLDDRERRFVRTHCLVVTEASRASTARWVD
jgi:hypothetical protein